MQMEYCGIAGLSVVLPETRRTNVELADLSKISAGEIFEETGMRQKPVFGALESPIELAVRASKQALREGNVGVEKVGLVLFCSAVGSEKRLWSPAAKIQQLVGIPNAFSFEVLNGCNVGNLGMEIASQFLRRNPESESALVVVADAMADTVDHADANQTCIFGFSDAATAIVLKRGETHCQPLAFKAFTDPQFVDHMYIPARKGQIWMNNNPDEDRRLSASYREMYPKMIREAAEKAGISLREVQFICMNQGDRRLIRHLSQTLDFPPEKIQQTYENYGHMGGSDVFWGLKEALANKRVKAGDYVVLASSAVGFSWGASVLRV